MSHYPVAVFVDKGKREDLDELLAPYDEDLEVEEYLDEDGEKTICNPDAKWDWYRVGGSYCECLPLKNGKKATIAKVSDIDFGINKEAYEKAERFWEVVVEGKALKDGESEKDFFTIYKPLYYKDFYKTKEYFAESKASFRPFAFLSSETGWQEAEEMGWFATSNQNYENGKAFDEKFKNFVEDPENQDKTLVVVDCHF